MPTLKPDRCTQSKMPPFYIRAYVHTCSSACLPWMCPEHMQAKLTHLVSLFPQQHLVGLISYCKDMWRKLVSLSSTVLLGNLGGGRGCVNIHCTHAQCGTHAELHCMYMCGYLVVITQYKRRQLLSKTKPNWAIHTRTDICVSTLTHAHTHTYTPHPRRVQAAWKGWWRPGCHQRKCRWYCSWSDSSSALLWWPGWDSGYEAHTSKPHSLNYIHAHLHIRKCSIA